MGVFNPSVDSSKLSAINAVSADEDSGASGNSENESMDENGGMNRPPTPAIGANIKGAVKIQTSSLHSRPFIGPMFPASNGLGENHIRRSSLNSRTKEDDGESNVSSSLELTECDSSDSGIGINSSSASSEHSKLVHYSSSKNGISSQEINGSSNGRLKSGPTLEPKQNGVVAQLPKPKVVLFEKKKITSVWRFKTIGSGLLNLGNTCYMNASLQVLMHTTPFLNWLMDELSNGHKFKCSYSSCTICPMTNMLARLFSPKNNIPVKPDEIHDKLNVIGRTFSYGRQEDSHEFMRLLLESLERSYLQAFKYQKLDSRSKETTPIGQIFGGYTRSEVRCLKCQQISTTFHPHAELQLDIREVDDVEEAIESYFRAETLDNEDYKCEFCKCVRAATKIQYMEVAPVVLCIQLKRFLASGGKIKKSVAVNERLDLTKYMYKKSDQQPSPTEYRLVGVVTHIGPTPNFGHYTAIARAHDGQYYHFDDASVRSSSRWSVQNADAYVLMYESVKPSSSSSSHSGAKVSVSSSIPSSTSKSLPESATPSTVTYRADVENGTANAVFQELKFAAKPSTITSLPEEASKAAAVPSTAVRPSLYPFSNVVNSVKKGPMFQYNSEKKPSKLVSTPPKSNCKGSTFLDTMSRKREKSAERVTSQTPPNIPLKPLVPYDIDDENDSEEESVKFSQNENRNPILSSEEPLEAGEAPDNMHQPTAAEAKSTAAALPEDTRKRENGVINDQPSPKAAKLEVAEPVEVPDREPSQEEAIIEGAAHSPANNTS